MPDLDITCSRCKANIVHHCHQESLAEAVIQLFMWRPEGGFPAELKKGNDHYSKEVNDKDMPFMSETFLYALLGKEDARSLLAYVRNILYSMGIEPRDFEHKAWEILNAKKRDQEAEAKRREENRERTRIALLPETRTPVEGDKKFTLCTYKTFYAFDRNVNECEDGYCNERLRMKPGATVTTGDKKEPQLDLAEKVDGQILVRCRACKRIHVATKEQLNGWENEPPYKITDESKRRELNLTSEGMLRADAVFTAITGKEKRS